MAANASEAISERFLSAVETSTEALTVFPAMGTPCPFLHPDLKDIRRIPVNGFENWMVFYRVVGGGVEVVRILHDARDIAVIVGEPDGRL
ncbi:MAG: type II toxin-antitoxin system RelE/ParE family toxin [Terracidiphilus sp.]